MSRPSSPLINFSKKTHLDVGENQVTEVPVGVVEFSAEQCLNQVISNWVVVVGPVGADVPGLAICTKRGGQLRL